LPARYTVVIQTRFRRSTLTHRARLLIGDERRERSVRDAAEGDVIDVPSGRSGGFVGADAEPDPDILVRERRELPSPLLTTYSRVILVGDELDRLARLPPLSQRHQQIPKRVRLVSTVTRGNDIQWRFLTLEQTDVRRRIG
jgi:hypothetical protein